MPAKPLNEVQVEDAKRLRAAWDAFRFQHPYATQEWLASECGWGTQGAVNQYLLGKIPLNLQALLKFVRVFCIDPASISPTLARQLDIGSKAEVSISAQAHTRLQVSTSSSNLAQDMSNVGKNIIQRRTELGWSQGTLALKAHVSQGTIRHLESGRNRTTRKLPEIATALGVSVEWLVTGRGIKEAATSEAVSLATMLEPATERILNAIAGLSQHQIEQVATAIETIRGTSRVPKNTKHSAPDAAVRTETADGKVIDCVPPVRHNLRPSTKKTG